MLYDQTTWDKVKGHDRPYTDILHAKRFVLKSGDCMTIQIQLNTHYTQSKGITQNKWSVIQQPTTVQANLY